MGVDRGLYGCGRSTFTGRGGREGWRIALVGLDLFELANLRSDKFQHVVELRGDQIGIVLSEGETGDQDRQSDQGSETEQRAKAQSSGATCGPRCLQTRDGDRDDANRGVKMAADRRIH